ncbi:MAG: hypothetical protein BMS9Abin39_0639 [Ignavibacteria bacterium]|nr:MAG: hypothetical protein BMS9Abin39_0639 [Ignavibacteria bacterium]
MIKKLILVSLIIATTVVVHAQVVYTPLYSEVYDFLQRMSIKQIIILDDEVKPYSRNYIAGLLKEIDEKQNSLNSTERELLSFYEKEYAYELNDLKNERWFLFSYGDSLFSAKFSPIAGYGVSSIGDANGYTRWIGFSTFGTYRNWFGASFDVRDKGEFGDNVDRKKSFSPETGAYYKGAPNGIEANDVKGSINFNWSWGSVSIIKDYFTWGHGNFGQLILSSKPPDYPRIELHLKPVEWLRFSYIHGWLNSLVIDSSSIQFERIESREPQIKQAYINKYIAANMLTITPVSGLDISVGNSFVYSGDLRPEMFIPFLFFKWLDHNTGRGSVNDGNGTLYLDISAKYPKDFQFYTTLFVDVTEIRNILESNFSNTWVGYTFGAKKVNLFLNNLDILVEYTRINPWVYEHKYESTTYKHLDYTLGHWLGQNADQIRIQFDYQPIRSLKFELYFEERRKGGLDDIYFAYQGMDEFNKSFLYSPLRIDKYFGLNFRFEYIHDLILEGSYRYSDVADEDADRTPEYLVGKNSYISLNLYYGL